MIFTTRQKETQMPRASEATKRSFRYQERPKESVRERANMKGGDFDVIIQPKYKVYSMRDGKNILRILPPTWDEAKHYGYDLYINYNIGVDNQKYLSLSKMKGEKDPIAEAKREAERDGDKKLAKELSPRQRIAMWVIDRQDEDEGPQIWMAPFTLDKAIANLSFDEDTKEVVFIDDPENGCDVRFYKEGVGLNTDYDASKIRIMKPSPLCQDEGLQNEWLEFVQAHPIPECLQFYDYDHIATAFDGQVHRKDEDAEGAPPRRQRAAPADDEPPFEPTRTRKPMTNGDDDTPPPRRARAAETSDDEPPARPSIRDRLQSRRSKIEEEVPADED